MAKTYCIGVDVGGTNTDAVFLCTNDGKIEVLASTKTPTTQDVVSGIQTALQALQSDQSLPRDQVACVFLGTTKFLNALLECKNLLKVGVVRLCLPTGTNHPPLIEWPEQLKNTVLRGSWLVHGGYEFYPESEISALDDTEFATIVNDLESMADAERPSEIIISGVHAPLRVEQEQKACEKLRAALAKKPLKNIRVTSSCEAVGRRIGILKRESAAVLNACLRKNASITVKGFRKALAAVGLSHARAYLTTSDGTVVNGSGARRRPVQCIASGPVNSIRGAGVLLNDRDSQMVFVVDVGGTTTDVGALLGAGSKQHVKESNSDSRVAGVRTNNRVADVLSIALGGGSIFRGKSLDFDTSSVGFQIKDKALCCGGATSTFTDVALACKSLTQDVDDGWASVRGDELRQALITQTGATLEQLQGAYRGANQRVADLVSRLKTGASNDGVRVVLAGGGGALLDGGMVAEMLGMSAEQVVTIPHGDVANACGAGIGQVGAELETTADIPAGDVGSKVAELQQQVLAMAIAAGGVEGTAVVAQQEVTAIPFVEGNTRRVYMKAVADLDLSAAATAPDEEAPEEDEEEGPVAVAVGEHEDAPDLFNPPARTAKEVDADGVWALSEYDIHCLGVGCGVLGSGGGGSTYKGFLSLKRMVRDGSKIRVVGPDTMPAEAVAQPVAFMGVPTVLEERIQVTGDLLRAGERVLDMSGGLKPDQAYILSAEVGGCNGLEPLVLQAQTGAFAGVLDADLMGRAFPELQMQTMTINSIPVLPAAVNDAHGRVVSIQKKEGDVPEGVCPYQRRLFDASGVLVETTDPWCYATMAPFPSDAKFLENEMRPHLLFSTNPFDPAQQPPKNPGMGMVAGLALRPMSRDELQTGAIPGTLSLGRDLGDAILTARREQTSVVEAVQGVQAEARLLASGIVDLVDTDTSQGFAKGTACIREPDADGKIEIKFQNEYLRCSRLGPDSAASSTLGEVPDLIVVLDAESGAPIATEELKYGLRVLVLSLPAHPRLRTPQALAVVGPAAFESLKPPA